MFGDNIDLGLDPNIVIGQDGRVKEIFVENKCFVVKHLIQTTKVWVASPKGSSDTYIIKDSWIQVCYVVSKKKCLKSWRKSSNANLCWGCQDQRL